MAVARPTIWVIAVGIEVRHQDVCHAKIGGERFKEDGEGFETAGRGADADDGKAIGTRIFGGSGGFSRFGCVPGRAPN